jgi:hypothetical protein
LIILRENMGQLHHHELQNPVAEINATSRVTWLQSMNYSHHVWSVVKQILNYDSSSVYWAQQNRCLLPDDGDRLQSPKRCVF